jgi:hypothetical protein
LLRPGLCRSPPILLTDLLTDGPAGGVTSCLLGTNTRCPTASILVSARCDEDARDWPRRGPFERRTRSNEPVASIRHGQRDSVRRTGQSQISSVIRLRPAKHKKTSVPNPCRPFRSSNRGYSIFERSPHGIFTG